MLRQPFLDSAALAAALIRAPEVTGSWQEPSALQGFTIGGLAAHLAFQTLSAAEVVREARTDRAPIALLDHYARAVWIDGDLESAANQGIAQRGEDVASDGAEALAARTDAALAELRAALPGEPADQVVYMERVGWALQLDDFLMTRIMEIVVHSDDLAVSARIETPDFPATVTEPVVDLLSKLSVRRHGATAVVRALSRAERAPQTISAL